MQREQAPAACSLFFPPQNKPPKNPVHPEKPKAEQPTYTLLRLMTVPVTYNANTFCIVSNIATCVHRVYVCMCLVLACASSSAIIIIIACIRDRAAFLLLRVRLKSGVLLSLRAPWVHIYIAQLVRTFSHGRSLA